jgi:hypothetical protein
MKIRIAFLTALILIAPSLLSASDLDPQTLAAWNKYVDSISFATSQRATGASAFLWIDEAPGRRARVRGGDIVAEPIHKDNPQKVPHGLIHDWVGAVFIPNTTIKHVYATLNDYGNYAEFYPAVVDAKPIEDLGSERSFSMELLEKAPFVTAAIEGEFVSHTVRVDDTHWYTILSSTRIQQIEDYGHAKEHRLPADHGTGYVWRLYAIQRFEERDGGVYAECEVIVLSRDIPFRLEWLVKPILQHLPKSAMETVLLKTRDAVCERNVSSDEDGVLDRLAGTANEPAGAESQCSDAGCGR